MTLLSAHNIQTHDIHLFFTQTLDCGELFIRGDVIAMTETLNSEEASSLLKCSKAIACELARTGEIPAVQLGEQWLFVKSLIMDYLHERAREEQALRRDHAAPNSLVFASQEQPRGRGRPRRKSSVWAVN